MRPYLLFISGIAGLAGMVLGNPLTEINTLHFLAFLSFFLSYGFGQALTDCYQVDTDKISSAYRPLSQGIIRVADVKKISTLGLVLCVVFLLLPNFRNVLLGILSILGLWSYSKVKRKFWYLGPIHNALIVALLPIMGFLVTSQGSFKELFDSMLFWLIILNFFAYANFVLIGYLKDITADRMTGYKTFPVVQGWNKTIYVGIVISIIASLSAAILIDWSVYSLIPYIMAVLFVIIGHIHSLKTNNKSEENARLPIEMTVRCFILWNIAVIISFRPELTLALVLYYCLFESILYFRPDSSQI